MHIAENYTPIVSAYVLFCYILLCFYLSFVQLYHLERSLFNIVMYILYIYTMYTWYSFGNLVQSASIFCVTLVLPAFFMQTPALNFC